jgi:hypothetical protein
VTTAASNIFARQCSDFGAQVPPKARSRGLRGEPPYRIIPALPGARSPEETGTASAGGVAFGLNVG